ncbi:hypothetical protein GCM10007860_11910 [Chitiniphilus shinanonensis]|uniref:Secreted protein n=1 Tax=Chitiniphilus shinanonensis TaxID=553088 RepID=A0ABQ6BPT4_9NEIS|nr:hypothetical protein [Chitiniphilus shinanonensis]GLS04045.1 hypothetical protein GCM10007860_11910 [Chitiniphilus shinanonensis]
MDKKVQAALIAGGVLAISMASNAYAAPCGGDVAATGTPQTCDVSSGDANGYVSEAFKLNISANVALKYDGSPTVVAVTSANTKGMHTFGGSSQGGAVAACEPTSVGNPVPGTPNLTLGCPPAP